MDRGTGQATVYGVAESDLIERLTFLVDAKKKKKKKKFKF